MAEIPGDAQLNDSSDEIQEKQALNPDQHAAAAADRMLEAATGAGAVIPDSMLESQARMEAILKLEESMRESYRQFGQLTMSMTDKFSRLPAQMQDEFLAGNTGIYSNELLKIFQLKQGLPTPEDIQDFLSRIQS